MTLVEILVVLAIVGVMAAVVTLGVGAADRGMGVETEANRLADRLRLAADDVMVTRRPLSLSFDGEGYVFTAPIVARTRPSSAAHGARLTQIIGRDEVIGRTISNLNTVLGTVDERDAALKELIDQLQRFVSGLAADRKTIGASLTNINSLTAQTADLLKVTRAPLKSDIANLRALTTNLNEPANTATFEKFLSTSPGKINTITRTATYGSWFNFYMCDFSGTIVIPAPVKGAPAIKIPVDKPAGLSAARCSS